jgi:hypothetical protein
MIPPLCRSGSFSIFLAPPFTSFWLVYFVLFCALDASLRPIFTYSP